MACSQSLTRGATLRSWVLVSVLILTTLTFFFLLHEPVQRRADVWDSAAYIDCARSIANGTGFSHRPLEGLDRPGTQYPIFLWPPGYPILIAGFSKFGFSPYQAAVGVAGVSTAAAALLIAYLAIRMFSLPVGLALTLSIISMPAFVLKGCMSYSEAPYMVMMLLSLLCMIRATAGLRISPGWACLAGILAGLAWCIRHVGVSLFAASLCYLACHLLSQHRRANLRAVVTWCVGCLVGTGWLIGWNIATFGSLSGYTMDPSNRPLLLNLRDAQSALAMQLLGVRAIARILATPVGLAVLGAGVVLLIAIWLKGKSLADVRSSVWERRHLFLFGLLAFFHILTLVVARTVYRWGVLVDEAHLTPICWVVPFLLVAGGISLCSRLGCRQGTLVILLVLVLGANGALQIRRQLRLRSGYMTHDREWVTASDLAELRREVASDQFVLCDHAAVLVIHADLDARYFAKLEEGRVVDGKLLTVDHVTKVGEEGWLWGICATDTQAFHEGQYGPFLKDLVDEPGRFPEFHAKRSSNNALILRYVGKQRQAGQACPTR